MFSGMTVKTKFERPVVKPKPPEEPPQTHHHQPIDEESVVNNQQTHQQKIRDQVDDSSEQNEQLDQQAEGNSQPKFSFIGKSKLRNKENSDSFKSDVETKEADEEVQPEKPKFSFLNKSKSNFAAEETSQEEPPTQEISERQEEAPKRLAFDFLNKKRTLPPPEDNQDSDPLHDSGNSSAKIERFNNQSLREEASGFDEPSEKTPKPKFPFLSKITLHIAKKKQEQDNSAEKNNDQENTINLSPVENKEDQSFEKPFNGTDDIVESLISSKSTQSKGNVEELSKLPARKHFVIGF
jgi:hypothetical protein